ncbi:MAG: IPT/TIG domain-containing protein, partial [Myxococcota bacterium]|nr:IPT/TIG domain-containing protein [Myxococcota bacterium]
MIGRGRRRRLSGLFFLLASGAWLPQGSAQDEVRILAEVLLEDPLVYEGGSLFGPPESRATWYGFGSIEPVAGNAMLAFSTGDADGPPVPGTDLGVADSGDDRAGMNLTLRVPDGAHSMRLFYRFVAPADLAEDSLLDTARLLVQGEPIGIDPWSLEPVRPSSAGLQEEPALNGTWYASPLGLATQWTEVVIPVEPGLQLLVTLEAADDPASDFGDVLVLLDGLRFDSGAPEDGGIRPGRVPLLSGASPARLVPGLENRLLLSGRDLPPTEGLEIELESGPGDAQQTVTPAAIHWLSAEQLELSLPPMTEGHWGVRLTWDGGTLYWPEMVEVASRVPRLVSIQPEVGPAAGGGLARISGLGFDEVSSLRFDDSPVSSFSVLSSEEIELVLPPGQPGPVDVSIFAEGGYNDAREFFHYSSAVTGSSPPSANSNPTGPSSCSVGSPPGAHHTPRLGQA